MGLIKRIFTNSGHPKGVIGKLMVSGMNYGHARVADWGMKHLQDIRPRVIADIGCGGGRNVSVLLAKYPNAKLFGLDHAEVSAEKAAEYNEEAIRNGRCKIMIATVNRMPFRDEVIDLATAFETVYFWPGPLESFREVYRVLTPGGTFLIVNETDGFSESDDRRQDRTEDMVIYTKDDLCEYLREAGFRDLTVDEDRANHNLCIICRK